MRWQVGAHALLVGARERGMEQWSNDNAGQQSFRNIKEN
jgi:hypothetical protein